MANTDSDFAKIKGLTLQLELHIDGRQDELDIYNILIKKERKNGITVH